MNHARFPNRGIRGQSFEQFKTFEPNSRSSIVATIEFLTSLPVKDGGPHDFRSKMAAPTTPRWRPPRNEDGGPGDAFGYTSEGESTP